MYNAPLYNIVKSFADSDSIRLHMPGHGGLGNMGILSDISRYDITELDATFNILDPESAPANLARRLCAQAFGAYVSLFSCSGATLALQTAILAAKKLTKDNRCLCDRRCHRSVINALTLLDMEPIWFLPDKIPDTDCRIMIFTSCDYYGDIVDLDKISNYCKENKIISIADNSHGTHLKFFGDGNLHPLYHNIDLVIDSAHKTLPVLTGGAYLHASNRFSRFFDKPDAERFLIQCMALFSTTSPSFLIAASLDLARAILQKESKEVFDKMYTVLKRLRDRFPFFSEGVRDPFRLVISGGEALYRHLENCGIICEFCDKQRVIMIPPWKMPEEFAVKLEKALSTYSGGFAPYVHKKALLPDLKRKFSLHDAFFSESEEVDLVNAVGKVSACEYSPYPPGIPLIVPGEVFENETIEMLKDHFNKVKILKHS